MSPYPSFSHCASVGRLLAEFTDGCPAARGLEAAEARLDGAVIDLTE
ncbi:hypothetical protein [Streptomyces sp. NBC_01320]|nr:hypothetical protein OG395_48755 [Streptomyces sp. NBC_01320]